MSNTNADMFPRARAALLFLGIGKESEDATELTLFLRYENHQDMLPQYQEWVDEIAARLERIEAWKFRHDIEAATSEHVGVLHDRMHFTATVEFHKSWATGDNEIRHITKLKDEVGNVLVYWNTVNIGKQQDPEKPEDPEAKINITAERGQKVTFKAGVREHSEYQSIKQTILERVMKAKLLS